MNLILLTSDDMRSSELASIKDERRLTHILSIQQPKLGDNLKIGMLNGLMGQGRVDSISTSEIVLHCRFDQEPPAPLPLTLILGLPRPKMLKRIFQTIATLGVKDLYLINSYRVEKSYWQSPFLEEDAIQQQLLLGLEQGCDTLLPRVHIEKRFKPFVEDRLADICRGTHKLVAHPYTTTECPRAQTSPLSLAVGPEGGFIPYEVELLESQGFTTVSLGPRIMRVETAIPYLLSRLF